MARKPRHHLSFWSTGRSTSIVVDFRALNKFLRRSPYYVPKIKRKCGKVDSGKLQTGSDRVKSSDRKSTLNIFLSSIWYYQFNKLPMRYSTAADEYQACMERILGDPPFVIVYLDSILSFSENPEDHLENLLIVFERLRRYDATSNPRKCSILRDQVDKMDSRSLLMHQAKKDEAILQISEPRNKNDLSRFLGMIAYYRVMVPNKSAMTSRLNRLTSKNVPFPWILEDAVNFEAVKA
ncbi:LOW QUALITY PROTEIN: Gag/polymerase/env Polyprotein [Phytophthora megakarya]|uniref:Gag/polymerase/env Polyprotein n=1 Tax=Phytophthora megakarya TaxID=4795 RepID=A0A225VYE9_9STRA|nr:LOW QUALITY PROTEIN: Gag/polymerase/env Polyprotein [Phytophthora megakarya]